MNRRDFLKSLPLAPVIFLQGTMVPDPDYQPIGYVDVRIHKGLHRYRVLDKYTGEDLTLKDKIVWADDRAGVYGRYKEPILGNEDINLETVKREIILVNDLNDNIPMGSSKRVFIPGAELDTKSNLNRKNDRK